MTTSITKSTLGTFVNASTAYRTTNYSRRDRFAVRAGTWPCTAYEYFSMPGPRKCKYGSVKLRLRGAGASGSLTYTVRRLTSKYANNTVRYTTRPSSTATNQVVKTQTVTSGGVLEFDITAIMQDVSDGAAWYGLEITMTGSGSARYFYNQHAKSSLAPVLTSEWSDAPNAPISLNPSEGRAVSLAKPVVSCDHVDVSGNTNLVAVQVQINATDAWGAPTFDSGEIATTRPQLDLATTLYAGIAAGTEPWWRIRLKDGLGLWSAYSAATTMTLAGKGTAVVSSPSAATPVVNDSTPNILWTIAGMTQSAYQVMLYTTDRTKLLWDSGKRVGTDSSATVGTGIVRTVNAYYLAVVRVWDTVKRATTVGDVPYVEASLVFQFVQSATVAPVTNLTVVPDAFGRPWATARFNRGVAPDSFSLIVDGEVVIENVDPVDALIVGTTYEITYREASPRKTHSYAVAAVENGVQSSANPLVNLTIVPVTAYLCSLDGEYAIPLTNYSNGMALAEESETFRVLGSVETINIYSGLRGFEGNFSGVMTGAVGNKTSPEYLDQLLNVRAEEGLLMVLTWADQSIRCVIKDVTYSTVVYTAEIVYAASFNVTQKVRVV